MKDAPPDLAIHFTPNRLRHEIDDPAAQVPPAIHSQIRAANSRRLTLLTVLSLAWIAAFAILGRRQNLGYWNALHHLTWLARFASHAALNALLLLPPVLAFRKFLLPDPLLTSPPMTRTALTLACTFLILASAAYQTLPSPPPDDDPDPPVHLP